jgi:hypothetical protein
MADAVPIAVAAIVVSAATWKLRMVEEIQILSVKND